MLIAKFAAGDRVMVRVTRDNPNIRPGVYTIVRSLPEGSAGRQYRAKNVLDEHERVFQEAELVKA